MYFVLKSPFFLHLIRTGLIMDKDALHWVRHRNLSVLLPVIAVPVHRVEHFLVLYAKLPQPRSTACCTVGSARQVTLLVLSNGRPLIKLEAIKIKAMSSRMIIFEDSFGIITWCYHVVVSRVFASRIDHVLVTGDGITALIFIQMWKYLCLLVHRLYNNPLGLKLKIELSANL